MWQYYRLLNVDSDTTLLRPNYCLLKQQLTCDKLLAQNYSYDNLPISHIVAVPSRIRLPLTICLLFITSTTYSILVSVFLFAIMSQVVEVQLSLPASLQLLYRPFHTDRELICWRAESTACQTSSNQASTTRTHSHLAGYICIYCLGHISNIQLSSNVIPLPC